MLYQDASGAGKDYGNEAYLIEVGDFIPTFAIVTTDDSATLTESNFNDRSKFDFYFLKRTSYYKEEVERIEAILCTEYIDG